MEYTTTMSFQMSRPVDPRTRCLATGVLKIGDNVIFGLTTQRTETYRRLVTLGVEAPLDQTDAHFDTRMGRWRQWQGWSRLIMETTDERYFVSHTTPVGVTLATSLLGLTNSITARWVAHGVLQLEMNLSAHPYTYRVICTSGNPHPQRPLDNQAVKEAERSGDVEYLRWMARYTGLVADNYSSTECK